jgi:hypothetical protein
VVEEGTSGLLTLELEEALQARMDDERRERLADVTALANTAGGDLVHGGMRSSAIPPWPTPSSQTPHKAIRTLDPCVPISALDVLGEKLPL